MPGTDNNNNHSVEIATRPRGGFMDMLAGLEPDFAMPQAARTRITAQNGNLQQTEEVRVEWTENTLRLRGVVRPGQPSQLNTMGTTTTIGADYLKAVSPKATHKMLSLKRTESGVPTIKPTLHLSSKYSGAVGNYGLTLGTVTIGGGSITTTTARAWVGRI